MEEYLQKNSEEFLISHSPGVNLWPPGRKGLKSLFFNARSLKARDKFDELKCILVDSPDLDIIVVVETWLSEGTKQFYNLAQYNVIHSVRKEKKGNNNINKRGGGISIWVHKTWKFHVNHVYNEGVELLGLVIKGNKLSYNVLAFYSPSVNKANILLEKLETILTGLNGKSIVMGDSNIDLCSNLLTPLARNYLDLFLGFGYTLCNNNYPTRVANNSASRIDHIFMHNISEKVTILNCFHPMSDHNILFFVIDSFVTPHREVRQTYCNINYNRFREVLKNNISDIDPNKDLDTCCKDFSTSFKKASDEASVIIHVTENKGRSYCPWINCELRQLIKYRNCWYKKWKKEQSKEKNSQYYSPFVEQEFKKYDSMVKKMKSDLKKNYYARKFHNLESSPKGIWLLYKQLMFNECRSMCDDYIELHQGNIVLKTDKEVANCFNEYFVSVAVHLAYRFPPVEANYNQRVRSRFCVFAPTTENEIRSIIKNLKSSQTKVTDDISSRILKECIDLVVSPISKIVNVSLAKGVVPTSCKIAKIIPVFKSGSVHSANNYRPISILPALSKILEKVVKARLLEFLKKYNILYSKQYGFREKLGTNFAVIEMISQIENAKDAGKTVAGLYIDLRKAFDTVNHELLLHKLFLLGVSGVVLEWFCSYLTARKQFVDVRGATSDERDILSGVPQGSVLGPLLFLIYVNDLMDLKLHSLIYLFADDTALVCEGDTCEHVLQLLVEDIHILNNWLIGNRLTINWEKTCFLLFGNNLRNDIGYINVLDSQIGRVNVVRYLGLLIDENLTWVDHIELLISKIRPMLFILFKLRRILTREQLLDLYYAYVHSRIAYLCVVWGRAKKTVLKRLITLQKRILKIIFKLPWLTSSEKLFCDNHVYPIQFIMFKQACTYVQCCMSSTDTFNQNFTKNSDIHCYETRSAHLLHLNQIRSVKYGEKSLFSMLLSAFNKVSHLNEGVTCTSVFKLRLKRYIEDLFRNLYRDLVTC